MNLVAAHREEQSISVTGGQFPSPSIGQGFIKCQYLQFYLEDAKSIDSLATQSVIIPGSTQQVFKWVVLCKGIPEQVLSALVGAGKKHKTINYACAAGRKRERSWKMLSLK